MLFYLFGAVDKNMQGKQCDGLCENRFEPCRAFTLATVQHYMRIDENHSDFEPFASSSVLPLFENVKQLNVLS